MRKMASAKMALAMCILAFSLVSMASCAREEGQGGKEQETKAEEAGRAEAQGVLMVVGEKSVSYEEAFAYIYLLKQQYEPGMGEDIWGFQVEDGVTFEVYAKEQIVDELTLLKIICQEAEVLGIALDEDEKQEAKDMAERFMKTVSKEDKEAYRLTKDRMASIYEEHILAEKVYEISTNEVDTNISDEEAKQVTIQYLMVMTKGTDRNGSQVEMGAEEKKAAKKKAKSLYKEAKKLDTSFYAFAEANTDAGEVELTCGQGDMPEDFREEAMALKTDQMSELIVGENGFYIVYCVSDYNEDATAAKKEEMIEEKQDALFRKKYAEWSRSYKLIISTALWDEIAF